jgi:hypothetical protein
LFPAPNISALLQFFVSGVLEFCFLTRIPWGGTVVSRILWVNPPTEYATLPLATRLAQGEGLLQVVDLKSIPLAHGHRIRGFDLPGSGVGVGPLGGFAGYVLMAVMNNRGLFFCWGLLPGNARETWGEELLQGLPAVLGDRGFRWVAGVQTPPYRLRGGKVVETGWRGWTRVRNWIETRFSVMVRSLGLHRLSARSFWGLVSRVNLIVPVHNLIRSRLLLEMAGVEL